MNNNIFQIIDETQLETLFKNKTHKLRLILYSKNDCEKTQNFMPKLRHMARKNNKVLFIYIDQLNYKNKTNNYFSKITSTPTFLYYIDMILLQTSNKMDEHDVIEKLITNDVCTMGLYRPSKITL